MDCFNHIIQTINSIIHLASFIQVTSFALIQNCIADHSHSLYGNELGILWLDSHRDVSTLKEHPHEHAMVLGNLLGAGDPELSKMVEFPFSSDQILYVGLQKPLETEVKLLDDLNLNFTIQNKGDFKIEEIQTWIEENGFTKYYSSGHRYFKPYIF